MGRRSLVLTVVATLCCVLVAAGSASADQPLRFTFHELDVICDDPLVSNGGVAVLMGGVNDQFGPFGDVAFWAGQTTPTGSPTLSTDYASTVTGTATATSLSLSIPLIDVSGDPDGTASVTATLVPVGDPVTVPIRERDGNLLIRGSETDQAMSITSGTLSIGGSSFSLTSCSGLSLSRTEFDTQPHAFSVGFADTTVFCQFSAPGTDVFLFADVAEGGRELNISFSDLPLFGYTDAFVLDQSTFSATVPMVDTTTGNQVEDATIDATVTAGEPFRVKLKSQIGHQVETIVPLFLAGTLDVPAIGETFDLSSCTAGTRTGHTSFNPSNGPNPTARRPVNDAPGGAITLTPGDRVTTKTNGASLDPEKPASCAPLGRTVWYRIRGTGSPITIDTAGSGFDTVVAVYTGSSFTEVACDDDVFFQGFPFSVQAKVTFDTVAGATYLVQVGGFGSQDIGIDPEFGTLRVHVS
jgi:hypothetical protein